MSPEEGLHGAYLITGYTDNIATKMVIYYLLTTFASPSLASMFWARPTLTSGPRCEHSLTALRSQQQDGGRGPVGPGMPPFFESIPQVPSQKLGPPANPGVVHSPEKQVLGNRSYVGFERRGLFLMLGSRKQPIEQCSLKRTTLILVVRRSSPIEAS